MSRIQLLISYAKAIKVKKYDVAQTLLASFFDEFIFVQKKVLAETVDPKGNTELVDDLYIVCQKCLLYIKERIQISILKNGDLQKALDVKPLLTKTSQSLLRFFNFRKHSDVVSKDSEQMRCYLTIATLLPVCADLEWQLNADKLKFEQLIRIYMEI
jgi:hypothetical protein